LNCFKRFNASTIQRNLINSSTDFLRLLCDTPVYKTAPLPRSSGIACSILTREPVELAPAAPLNCATRADYAAHVELAPAAPLNCATRVERLNRLKQFNDSTIQQFNGF
jgi:hypothetical protein